MKVIIDTHTLVWFLFSDGKLSNNARKSLLDAEIIFLPTIVLLEAFYVSKKLNFEREFRGFLTDLPSPKFQNLCLDIDLVNTYVSFNHDLEIHDGIIVSSARLSNLPIVTKDQKISEIYPKVIW